MWTANMRGLRGALAFCGVMVFLAGGASTAAPLELRLPRLHPNIQPQATCSVLSGHPCHPSFCSLFHRGPCEPYYWPPIGENLQLTIVSTDDNDPVKQSGSGNTPADADKAGSDTSKGGNDADQTDESLDSIGQMFAALRACWVPPQKEDALHGMQYTVRFAFKRDGDIVAPPFVTYASHTASVQTRDVYRDAVNAALSRCMPLHFSKGMAGAVVGRPIDVRFVDNRTTDKSLQ
jgi:hypothetical protein